VGELPIVGEGELRLLLEEVNATEAPVTGLCVDQLFAAQAARTPDRIAASFAGRSFTYAELNARSNRLARRLRELGVGPDVLVAVCLERSLELVVAVLGVLKAGGAYVALDPGYPGERKALILEDSNPRVVVTLERWAAIRGTEVVLLDRPEELSSLSETDLPPVAGPDDLAYVLYTSGSTGRPKGVMVPHRGLVGYLEWCRQAYGLTEGGKVPVHSPLGFDLTVTSLFAPLLVGATLLLLPEEEGVEPLALLLREGQGLGLLKLTPAHLEILRRSLPDDVPAPWADTLVLGGEALHREQIAFWRARSPQTRIFNEYGPTETVVGCCVHEVAGPVEAAGPVPIGRPIDNARLYVLDGRGAPVPFGATGELYVGGLGVTRGYLGRPGLTAERFVPDPFGPAPGSRLYRTGDLVRFLPEGELEFLGRNDQQVKIRGYRIELEEIESVLRRHGAVEETAVVAWEPEPGQKEMVAYVVGRECPGGSELRAYLSGILPAHMVPGRFVQLPELPLTSHGKVDRRQLADPALLLSGARAERVAPRTPVEARMAALWTEVLHQPEVGATDNFFDLGGDSIKGVRLVGRINEELGANLRMQDIFQHQTLEALARQVLETSSRPSLTTELAAGLEQIEKLRAAILSDPEQRSRLAPDCEDILPLTSIETGMAYYTLLLPDEPVYHDQTVYPLNLEDPERFLQAFRLLTRKHAIFRSRFHLYGFQQPVKVVAREVPVPLDVEDLSGLSESERLDRIVRYREADLADRFRFDGELLWRLKMFRLEGDIHCIVWTWHHAMLDGWSNLSFWTEVNAVCGLPDLMERRELPELESRYRDYVALGLGRRGAPETEVFWRETLAGSNRNKLPFNRSRSRDASARGMLVLDRDMSGDLLESLRGLGRELHVSLQVLCLAAHLYLLHVVTAEEDVVTGLVSHDRPEVRDGDRILGCFLNTVPVRIPVGRLGDGLSLVREVGRYVSREKQHEIPLVDIAAIAGIKDAAENPIFDTIFNYMDFHVIESAERNVVFQPMEDESFLERFRFRIHEMTNTLFDLEVSTTFGRFLLRIKYSPRYFGEAEIRQATLLYERILERFVRELGSRVDGEALLSEAERNQLVHGLNDTVVPYRWDLPVPKLFEDAADRFPERRAVGCADRGLTYAELEERSNRLAWLLRARGIGRGENVGIVFPRSVELVVALLGVLKAGAAYVPLEPDYPPARKGYIARQSGVRCMLADRVYPLEETDPATPVEVWVPDDAVLATFPATRPELRVDPMDLAYTIYTSGSTGRPKGVMIEHRSVINVVDWVNRELGVSDRDTLLMLSSICFDLSVYDVFGGFAAGARVVLAEPEDLRDPSRLKDLLSRERISFWNSVPSTLGQLVSYLEQAEPGWRDEDLRVIFLSGDWIPLPLPERARRFFPNARCVSLGGATEATVWSIFHSIGGLDPSWVSVPYGRPIDNTLFYVLDHGMGLAPQGVVGELFIGGVGVARGYSGDPEKTAASFVPDRFSAPGGRMYRTGDLGRMLPDGSIEFLGRTDHQVKIRGFRVELGEIESQILRHPEVREAVVVARADRFGEKSLCAYVVAPSAPSPAALRAHLATALPEYMVPTVFIALDRLPLTANGKLDRQALPTPDEARDLSTYEPARNGVEEVLAALWSELLGVARPGIRDDFFEAGGHSLLATQLASRVRGVFGVDLPLRALFEEPNIAALAARVQGLLREGRGLRVPPIRPVPREGPLELSFAQQRLWFIEQLEPGGFAYNLTSPLRVNGALDVDLLSRCLTDVVRRHETLRTRFSILDGRPVQMIDPPAPQGVPVVDLAGLPRDAAEAEARRVMRADARQPFDLSTGPLFRLTVLRRAVDEWDVLLTMHHVVTDGWSMGLLVRELSILYEAFHRRQPSPLPEPEIQYADFAAWQRQWLAGDVLARELAHWRDRLGGAPQSSDLPIDRPRPAARTYRGAAHRFTLPAEVADGLRALAQRRGGTLFMAVLAAFQTLLLRVTGQADRTIGTPIAGRNHLQTEELIGFFVNTLVLRCALAGNPRFTELLGELREVTVEAYAHQDLPFEKLVEELQTERALSRTPLFQVMLAWQNAPAGRLEAAGLGFEPIPFERSASRFDLALEMAESAGTLEGSLTYSTDLFDRPTVARLADQLARLVAAVVDEPERRLFDLPLLGEPEAQALLLEWNDTRSSFEPGACLHGLFAAQARRTPDAPAVVFQDRSLTFEELDRRSTDLAVHLQDLGVGPDVAVGLCCERSPEMVVGLLGILKAGGAYVPLDPAYPRERLELLLEDIRPGEAPAVLVTAGPVADGFRFHHGPVVRLGAGTGGSRGRELRETGVAPGDAANAAYVIYTSGSTGKPKGVVVEHRQVVNYVRGLVDRLGLVPGASFAMLQPLTVDSSVSVLYPSLVTGGALHLISEADALDPSALSSYFGRQPIDCLKIAPSHLAALRSASPDILSRRWLVFGGEASRRDWAVDLMQAAGGGQVFNHYGPTEATVGTLMCRIEPGLATGPSLSTPLGHPMANTRAHVLDSGLATVAPGVAGELFLGGECVARGYLRRPDLTAERFVPDPWAVTAGARLYRTGDLVRLLPDGKIEFLGRLDHQVKIRGFRIELGEVEAMLCLHPGVREGIVAARKDEAGGSRLVAYVVPRESAPPPWSDLQRFLRERLPEHMVPSAGVFLAALPRTPHGKLDRLALPAPSGSAAREPAAPRTPAEEVLAGIWADVLGIARSGGRVEIHDNFFELGGDSILSIQVVARASRAGYRITPRQLFEHQTVASLAAVASRVQEIEADRGPVTGAFSPTPIQSWFFAQDREEPHHFNQSLLLGLLQRPGPEASERALAALFHHHDALRLRFAKEPGGWRAWNASPGEPVPSSRLDLSALPPERRREALERAAEQAQESLVLADGPVARAVWFDLEPEDGRLLLAVHHLAVDGVSWRILLEDLETSLTQASRGEAVHLPARTTSFRDWANALAEPALSMAPEPELSWWREETGGSAAGLSVDLRDGANTEGSARRITVWLEPEETRALLQEVPGAYRTQINEVLLTALAQTLARPGRPLVVSLEGHGREEEIVPGADLSRTVGWFTTRFPVRLEAGPTGDPGAALRAVKEHLRATPRRGIGYGLLRSVHPASEPEVGFNYLGQLDQTLRDSVWFKPADEAPGTLRSPRGIRNHLLEVGGSVTGGRLRMDWLYSANLHRPETVERWAGDVVRHLRSLIDHCRAVVENGTTVYTPADFPLAGLGTSGLRALLGTERGVEDLYPLSPLQDGLFFHSLYAPRSGVYVQQLVCRLEGEVDEPAFAAACAHVVERNPVLRTSFHWRELERPLQCVHAHVPAGLEKEDWSGLPPEESEKRLAALLREDREREFDLARAPLMRWVLIRTGGSESLFLWSHHHILLDGWSFAILAGEFLASYDAFRRGETPVLPRPRPYRDYIAWLERQDLSAVEEHWRNALAGWTEPVPLPEDTPAPTEASEPGELHARTSPAVFAALQAAARGGQVTLNTLAQAAWGLLLSRTSGLRDLVFGVTLSGRSADLPGIQSMVGLFINTLPLRLQVTGEERLRPWLKELQQRQSELLQYEHSPLLRVQEWSEIPQGRPLFETVLVFENFPLDTSLRRQGTGLRFTEVRAVEQGNIPLALVVAPGEDLAVGVLYDRTRLGTATVHRILGHYLNLLEGMAARLGSGDDVALWDLPLLSEGQRQQLVSEWNDTELVLPSGLVHEQVSAQARRRPAALAVRFGDRSLSYGELEARSNQLARALRSLGVGPEVRVGVCMERSLEVVVVLLGILKSGGAYLPLDPGYPAERLMFMVEDGQVSVLVCEESLRE
ncbi:MAG: amino acid adenylation domain-containing protein, partial [Acidobacteriota bacterium]